MANSQYLKRHSMPTTWQVKRKNIKFVAKPKPGSHKLDYVVPVVVLFRDVLGYVKTSKEAKLVIHNSEILLNGKKITDILTPCGFFDVIEIKKSAEKFTIIFDELGKIKTVPVIDNLLYMKVSGKKIFSGKRYQVNFMNGFNLIVDEKFFNAIKIEDTVIYDFVKKKIVSTLNMKEGAFVYIFDGKFKGSFAKIISFDLYNGLTRDVAEIEIATKHHSTAKDYCFVVGSKKEDMKRFA